MPARDIRDEFQTDSLSKESKESFEQDSIPTQLPIQSIQIEASEDLQKTLVEVVMDDFSHAESDRNDRNYGTTSKGEKLGFTDWLKRLKDLYNSERIPKTIPWRFCSNRSLRIATSVVDLLHSRLFPAVWNEELTRWRTMKAVDTPKVERITKLMDWWIRIHSPLRSFYDNWTKCNIGFGDSFSETYWDVEEFITSEQEQIPVTDEQGQPLINQDGTPAIQSQPRIRRVEKSCSRIINKENVYFMKGARDEQRDPVLIKETLLFKDIESMARLGAIINIDKLREMILIPEPSGNLPPDEKERIKQIKLRNMPVEVIREYFHFDIDGVGINESVRIIISPEHRLYLGCVRMRDITKSGRRPIKFTKYDSYLDRPEELDGEGVLHKVRELSEEIDAIFNQMTDAHTLAVLRPFFYDPSGDLDAPAINLGPNKGIPVTDPQRNIYFPSLEIPTERLINAIRMILEFIERLTAASSYVMGKESEIVGGSGTATRTQAIMQSAEIRFTLPSERLRLAAGDILEQHLDLIQLHIPQGLEQRILGEKGQAVFRQGELSEEGISGEYDAFLLPDPSMGSKQSERELMGILYSMLMQNIIVGTDPMKIHYITSEWLKANGKDESFILKSLGPAPKQDDIDDPEDENTLMIQGDFARVTPQISENHMHHIQTHISLQTSPSFQSLMESAPELTTQITEYNKLHIQQHMEMMGQMMALMQKVGGGSAASSGINQGPNPNDEKSSRDTSMENVEGPAGKALNAQREGKVGSSTGSNYRNGYQAPGNS